MAKETNTPVVQNAPVQDEKKEMQKYMIYKMVKKTNLNPEGKKLLMVTFAPSIEAASELARQMIEAEDGPRWEIVPVK